MAITPHPPNATVAADVIQGTKQSWVVLGLAPRCPILSSGNWTSGMKTWYYNVGFMSKTAY